MSKPVDIRPLPKDMLSVGVPLAHSIYNDHGALLLRRGIIIKNQSQLNHLYEQGLYLNSKVLSHADEPGKAKPRMTTRKNTATMSESEQPPILRTLTELTSKDIKLGESLHIKPLADDTGNIEYFVKYIGGVEKKSLICTLPVQDEKVVFIKENSSFSVRIFSGKSVFTFNTMVDAVFTRPYPHMHLKYPREVYTNRLRRNQRISANIITALLNKSVSDNENLKNSGRIIDLSLGGAMIESAKASGSAGETIECAFKISMNGGEALFVIQGTLRTVNENMHKDGRISYRHGIQFDEISFQEKIMLQSFIFQTLTGEKIDDL